MYLTFPSVKFGYARLQYLGGKVVVVVLGDNETGVTFLPGLGAFVAFGLAGLLVSRVVRAGGVGAVHAGVITGRIILSVVRGVVLLLVGPWVTGATVVTLIFFGVVFGISGGGVARVLGRNCVVRLVGSGRLGVSTKGGVYWFSGVQAGVISSFK